MIYYVSNEGDDNNDGRSENTAFATVEKVNAAVRGGDTVRFRRGDTFYGTLNKVQGDGKTGNTVFEDYGTGKKPVISLYKTAVPDAWESFDENIWRLDLTESLCFTGNVLLHDTNVGFLRVDGKIFGRKLFNPAQLHTDWDFYSDSRFVYVFCTGFPGGFTVDIACDSCGVLLGDYTTVSNLEIVGSGGHGIRGGANHCIVKNCCIHQIGGAFLPHYIENTRYGNGIELWNDSEDVVIENNCIFDVYDVAFTMQGNDIVNGWVNIVFRNNIIWSCEQSFEIWSKGEKNGFIGCRFEGNVCCGAGYGWSHNVRPDRAVAVHLLMYELECPLTDITLRNNVFYNPMGGLYSKTGTSYEIPSDYNSDENFIYMRNEQELCVSGLRFTIEEHELFSLYYCREKNSVFHALDRKYELCELWRLNHDTQLYLENECILSGTAINVQKK